VSLEYWRLSSIPWHWDAVSAGSRSGATSTTLENRKISWIYDIDAIWLADITPKWYNDLMAQQLQYAIHWAMVAALPCQ
jgi:hypothetical protein